MLRQISCLIIGRGRRPWATGGDFVKQKWSRLSRGSSNQRLPRQDSPAARVRQWFRGDGQTESQTQTPLGAGHVEIALAIDSDAVWYSLVFASRFLAENASVADAAILEIVDMDVALGRVIIDVELLAVRRKGQPIGAIHIFDQQINFAVCGKPIDAMEGNLLFLVFR